MVRILGLWVPVLAFMAGIWFLSDDLSTELPELFSDKILHVGAYGAFGLANLRAFHGGFRPPVTWATLAALGLTAGFGALDEWRQAEVSIRDASWGDWGADVIGGVGAWLALKLYPFQSAERARVRIRDGEG